MDVFIPSNGEYPQTSIFLELPWPTWQKWKCIKICGPFRCICMYSIYTQNNTLIESFSMLSLLQKSQAMLAGGLMDLTTPQCIFPTSCSSRKHSTHPCSFYHFPSGSSAECKVSRYEGQALSRCVSGWRRYQRNDILGIRWWFQEWRQFMTCGCVMSIFLDMYVEINILR